MVTKLAFALFVGLWWVLFFILVFSRDALVKPERVETLQEIVAPYLPGQPAPMCTVSYYSMEYVSCIIYDVPGFEMLSLTVSEYSGHIFSTYAVLVDAVTIGELELEYGDPEIVIHASWEFRWTTLKAYKYSVVGRPSLFTEVRMLSWR